MLTALPLERAAVCEHLTDPRMVTERATEYTVGRLDGAAGEWTVAVVETRAGPVSAAVHVGRAIEVFSPDVLLFVGVAGGVKDVGLGDVVAADAVYDYEAGKDAETFARRGAADKPAYRLVQRALGVARDQRWLERIKPSRPLRLPAAMVGPIAAGNKVVASTDSATFALIRRDYSDALAVEMEGSGFLRAAYEYETPAIVVRGISDLVDGKVAAKDELWQPIAARHAAAFAIELLATLEPGRADGGRRWRPPPEYVAPDRPEPLVVAFAPVDRSWATWTARVLRESGYDVALREEAVRAEGTLGLGGADVATTGLGADEATARAELLDRAATVRPPDRVAAPAERFADGPRFPAAMPPIWHVPVPRSVRFTGRSGELRALAEALASRETTAVVQTIAGLGGIGKTTLAVEHAYRRSGDYDVVWWVRAEDPTVLAADIAALAGPLGLVSGAFDQSESLAAVRRWLEGHSRWLLVFDNAETPEAVEPYLPRRRTGHVLVTSRNQHWPDADMLPLAVPPEDEAIQLIRRRAETLSEPDARRLAEAVGRLPKALEVAAAYIRATGCPVDEYLTRIDVAGLFKASFVRVDEDADAAALLDACALLAPEDIPRPLLVRLVGDAARTDKAIRTLRAYSLVDVAGDAVSLHRLVQHERRDRIGPERMAAARARVVRALDEALPERHDDVAAWPTFARLLPHVLTAVPGSESAAAVSVLARAGNYQLEVADFAGARATSERALTIAESTAGPADPGTAATLGNLAMVLEALGDAAGARPLLERALAIREAALGPAHPEVATDLSNLAMVLYALADTAGARPLLERALAIDEAARGPAHPEVATDLSNLAMVLRALGDAVGARPLLERALAIDEAALGPAHPKVATDLSNLAMVLRALGDAVGARPLLERALAINEAALGPGHPRVATTLSNLATVLYALGDAVGARPLLERALTIDEAALGPAHPEVATTLGNLALVLKAVGDAPGARPLLERALAIEEAALGPAHPKVATIVGNLATVLHALGEAVGARLLLERALTIDEAVLGPAHPKVATDLGNLALVLKALGDAAGARPLLERALAIEEAALGPAHPKVATALGNLALVLKALGDAAGARPLLERALEIKEAALGPAHPAVATTLGNLATVLAALGDAAGARPLLERALAIHRRIAPDGRDAERTAARLAALDENATRERHRVAVDLANALLAARIVAEPDDLDVRAAAVVVPTPQGPVTVQVVAPARLDAGALVTPPPGHGLVVVADAVPEWFRHELRRRGWGWLDRRGHLRVVAPGLDIETDLATATTRQRRRRLFSAVGTDVAFELLVHPEEKATVRGLARATGRSPSQVSTVLAAFRENGFVTADGAVAATELFPELAAHWRPERHHVDALPQPGDPVLASEQWVLTDTAAAVAWGVPLVTRADAPPDFYVPSEDVLRHARRVLGEIVPGRHACTVAMPPARGVLRHAVPGDDGRLRAHPLAVALDLATDSRGREALASWDPPAGYLRVW
ncbi:MAG TPA: tetratricopeptide repeat protein [Mycobacteriales bacterium]|nr:tetratricopeptide repeat protein [Mycobacteriales bacterium]